MGWWGWLLGPANRETMSKRTRLERMNEETQELRAGGRGGRERGGWAAARCLAVWLSQAALSGYTRLIAGDSFTQEHTHSARCKCSFSPHPPLCTLLVVSLLVSLFSG